MEIEYDEKGKFFTDVISKEVIRSEIQTETHHIRGNVHVRKGDRLSDEINQPNLFLPVTNAEIFNRDGLKLWTSDFLVVNREHIIWLMPVEEHRDAEE
jgi:fructose-1-phosphate kinase PfkB-like protein